jgi:hypothetical protein
MQLIGMPLGTLLSIGAAVAAAAVILYILKLRRRPVPVPFSRIWERVLSDKEATTLFSQLKRLLSLLLQLAMIAALVFALGDPRMGGDPSSARNVVVLVDGSASMKATDVLPSRIDVARQEVEKLVRGLSGSDRLLIAQMAATVAPLSTLTGDVPELNQAARALRATDTAADLGRGINYALDALDGLPNPEIVLVSDGALADAADLEATAGVKLSYVPIGKAGQNLAITQFSVRRYPLDKSRYEVLLEVTNTNDSPATVELTLLGDGQIVDVSRLELKPGERLPRFYKDLGGASRTLEAVIRPLEGARDHLGADNHAYALMPERRRSHILVVTAGNTYLEAALLLDEYLDVETIGPRDYPPKGIFDVTIFDRVAPQRIASTGAALYLGPPAEGSPVKLARAIEEFGFDSWDKKSPLLRWIAPDDIQVARGHTFKPAEGDHVIGASELGPILVSGSSAGQRFVVLGFDPRDSDFVLRTAWPLFVLNTINAFVEEDAQYLSSYRTGQVWQVAVPSGTTSAKVTDPSGRARDVSVEHGRAVLLGEQAGFYELDAGAGTDTSKTMFAANLSDIDESHISPRPTLEVASVKAGAVAGFTPGIRRELWVYLLALVVLVSTVEWLTYHRRWTV